MQMVRQVDEMQTVKVSSKYQVALPSNIRKKLHISPGQELQVEIADGAICLSPVPKLEDIVGLAPGLRYEGVREKEDRL